MTPARNDNCLGQGFLAFADGMMLAAALHVCEG